MSSAQLKLSLLIYFKFLGKSVDRQPISRIVALPLQWVFSLVVSHRAVTYLLKKQNK